MFHSTNFLLLIIYMKFSQSKIEFKTYENFRNLEDQIILFK